jgi:uncharacterized heparinase superfamily protein
MTASNTINKLILFFHTIRYLKLLQIVERIRFRYSRPVINRHPAPPRRHNTGLWCPPCVYPISQTGPAAFRFLNEMHELESANDWNHPDWEKLWLYNLHYFAGLHGKDSHSREFWHSSLIERWIQENPPVAGNGWESYPLSLRIVNWIKWSLNKHTLQDAWHDSLVLQIRYLQQRLEWHLLGNHLLANAKALMFAGCYFSGAEAGHWLASGRRIMQNQLAEQILTDGGHFERSPMYHSLILEDLLDILNLARTYPQAGLLPPDPAGYLDSLQRMRHWLQTLTHPDGDIAFFNDAATGIACPPAVLEAYAGRLGLPAVAVPGEGITALPDSGYLRLQTATAVALLDVAPIGPDYLPGHAHADTLSFELSLFGQRVLVNSGTSCYGSSRERLRQRATPAHNTVAIDAADSSEVWSGFRVARRARPLGLQFSEDQSTGALAVRCGHDGYRRLPGRPLHWRRWHLQASRLQISDTIEGGFRNACAYFHFHPAVTPVLDSAGTSGSLQLEHQHSLHWRIENGRAELQPASYHPEFGVSQPGWCLLIHFNGNELQTCFDWH